MTSVEATLFENTTDGNLGVIKVSRRGEIEAIAVPPRERVLLTEEEQELTANAPKRAEDSPFQPHPYREYDEAGELVDEGVRPQLVKVEEDRPTPAKASKGGEPPAVPPAVEGKRDPKEVVGA